MEEANIMDDAVMDTTKLQRQKINIFSEETTYNADYMPPSFMCRIEPSNKPRPFLEEDEPPNKPQEFRDIETFYNFDPAHYVPFDMLWKPKPILQTYPTETFVNPYKGKKKGVVVTEAIDRPRVFLEPAICMDDLEPRLKAEVCDSVYRSVWNARGEPPPARDDRYRCLQYRKDELVSTLEYPGGDPTAVKQTLIAPLRPGWHRFAENWDSLQLRAAVDPTKTFWINKDPPVKCGACTDPLESLRSPELSAEIIDRVQTNTIRIAHDMLPPGYSGYRPEMATGVSLEKIQYPINERFVTTAEVMNRDITPVKRRRFSDMVMRRS